MLKVLVNIDMLGVKKGETINLQTDKFGTPLKRFWRNRLKDSKIDNCITVINEVPKKAPKKIG